MNAKTDQTRRPRGAFAATVLGVVSTMTLLVGPSPAAGVPAPSCLDFDSAGATGVMSCEVPEGVSELQFVAEGAGGGGAGGTASSGADGAGGSGARVIYDMAVTAGETLTLEVGTGGGATSNRDGAGGGGWTAVKRGSTILLLAAGGGGAGSDGAVVAGGDASAGGTADGGDGQSGNSDLFGGEGATTTAGGAGGLCVLGCAGPIYNGSDGLQYEGGAGSDQLAPNEAGQGGNGWQGGAAGTSGLFGTGGGGGAGYYGGGGGASRWFALSAGGGAGSSYPATGATYETADNGGAVNSAGGDGSITISSVPPPPPVDPGGSDPLDPIAPGTNPAIPADGLRAGQSVLLVDGAKVPVRVRPNRITSAVGLVVTARGLSPDLTMRLEGRGDSSDPLGLTAKQALILQSQAATATGVESFARRVQPYALSSGGGFKRRSPVKFYLLPDIYLGELTTDRSGNYSGKVPIPPGIAPGRYTMQVNGLAPDDSVRSLSLGVKVETARGTAKASIYFAGNSAVLTAKSKANLRALVATTGTEVLTVRSVGFVLPTGGTRNDLNLSRSRARNVVRYLRALGVEGSFIVQGAGRDRSPVPRARRVDVTVVFSG